MAIHLMNTIGKGIGDEPAELPDVKVIGQNIRELREAKVLEQQELARRVGIKPVQMWKYEAGRVRRPSLETLHKIAHELGVTIDRLLDDSIPGAKASA